MEEYHFSEGKSGKSNAVGSAMQQLGFVSTTPGVLPGRWPTRYRNYTFQPFLWPSEPDEARESPQLLAHFQQQLEHLGVAFGPGAFQLLDVRQQDRLGFCCDTGSGTLVFHGGTDAVIVPYGELNWELQLCMVVDWKTPKSFKNLQKMDLQQKLELMGTRPFKSPFYCSFHRPHELCHLSTLCRCDSIPAHLCSSSIWSDCSSKCSAIHCSATYSCKLQGPQIPLPAP